MAIVIRTASSGDTGTCLGGRRPTTHCSIRANEVAYVVCLPELCIGVLVVGQFYYVSHSDHKCMSLSRQRARRTSIDTYDDSSRP
jgi:hypothetical protein